MANKFHVSADGNPHPCFAEQRPCPLGGEENHYPSMEEARTGFEAKMADETFNPVGKKGYTITTLMEVGVSEVGGGVAMQRLPVKGGFESPNEAIDWAKANLSDATQLVNIVNEEWDSSTTTKNTTASPRETGDFKTLNLVDISEERQLLEGGDIPKIAKFYIDNYGKNITDVHKMRLFTYKASKMLDADQLGRLRGYLKAATYGKKA